MIPIALAVALFGVRACIHTEPLAQLRAAGPEAGDPPNAPPLTGSVYVARGGPLIIGFQSPTLARLSVNGRELRGSGVVKERILVPVGPLAIRFAAPPGARLVWSPVGRRGDPEYLPASSISPEPPATATFSGGAGAARSDGAIALALLLVLVGSLLMLARARLAKVPRAMWIALGVTFALALAVRWIGLGDQGQTWDEDVNWAAGRNYVTNLLGLQFSEAAWIWNFEHPPVMKLLDGIGAQLSDGFGPARAMSAIWTALGCAFLVPIGARLASVRVGVLAAVIAALVPPLVAHGQVVGHESPTVLWWSLGVLLALGVHDEIPATGGLRHLILRMVAVGAAVGIAVASRFVNGLLGPLCILIIVVRAPNEWRRETVIWIWVT
ncbi:MAG: glycosyltransferase family 39 protein, partial [Polyangiales bacterium]